MLRDVYLYGVAGKMYGRHFRLDVSSPQEAVKAISVLRPGAELAFRKGDWRIIVGTPHISNSIGPREVNMNLGELPIHIVPSTRPRGGDGASVGKIVAGVVLIGAAIAFAPAAAAGAGFLGAEMGAGIGFMGMTYGSVAMLGASMVLGGVAALMTQPPKVMAQDQPTAQARPEDRPSFLFNGAVNNSQQGSPVPLVFGEHLVGSIVILAGLNAEDIAV